MFNQKKIIIPKLDVVELDEYISLKEAQKVIFNDDLQEDLERAEFRRYVESEDFLGSLTEFVALNYITEIADHNIKTNIFNVIGYLRNNKRFENFTDKTELFDTLNELIMTLNSTSDANNIDFYRNQYYRRIDQKKTDFWDNVYDINFIEGRKENLNYSISLDYQPIYDLAKIDNEQIFTEDVVSDNLVSNYFINTLNMLFIEMPGLYSDSRFVKRAQFILQNTMLLLKGKESDYELDEYDVIDDDLAQRTKKLIIKIKRNCR